MLVGRGEIVGKFVNTYLVAEQVNSITQNIYDEYYCKIKLINSDN